MTRPNTDSHLEKRNRGRKLNTHIKIKSVPKATIQTFSTCSESKRSLSRTIIWLDRDAGFLSTMKVPEKHKENCRLKPFRWLSLAGQRRRQFVLGYSIDGYRLLSQDDTPASRFFKGRSARLGERRLHFQYLELDLLKLF